MGESCAGSRAGSVGCSEHHSQRFLSLREVKIAISLLERALYVSYNPLGGTGPAPEAVSGKNNCQVVFEHGARAYAKKTARIGALFSPPLFWPLFFGSNFFPLCSSHLLPQLRGPVSNLGGSPGPRVKIPAAPGPPCQMCQILALARPPPCVKFLLCR